VVGRAAGWRARTHVADYAASVLTLQRSVRQRCFLSRLAGVELGNAGRDVVDDPVGERRPAGSGIRILVDERERFGGRWRT
jgi:hypothetical protein